MIKILVIYSLIIGLNSSFAQNHYWENIEGLYGGLISSICFNNTDIYCAGNGGVYKSTDNGETWFSIGLKDKFIGKIIITANHIFAISRQDCFRMNLSDTSWTNVKKGNWQSIYAKDSTIFLGSGDEGVFRSTDLGITWLAVNNGIDNRDIEELFITSNNIVLASAAGTSGSGVFRSTNNGESWERIDPNPYAWNFEGITEYNNVLYAFDFENSARVYKSTDFGRTWFLPPNSVAPSDIIQTIYADETGIYVGVFRYGIFKSTNEGASWRIINSGLENKNVLAIKGNFRDLFCASYDGIYKSPKSNFSWIKNSNGINNVWITVLAANGNKMFLGTYGSGLISYENSTFKKLNLGPDLLFILDLKIYKNQIYVLATGWGPTMYTSFLFSSDNGNNWIPVNNGFDTGGLECIDVNDRYIYVGSSFGLFRKQINGYSWEKLTNGIPYNINTSSVASSDSVVIVTDGTSLIYRSTNYGNSWSSFYVPNLFSGVKIYSHNKGEFYLGSGSVNNLLKSTDYGNTWKNLNIPLFNSGVQAIKIINNELFVGLSNNGILVSSNNGVNWYQSELGLYSKNITGFANLANVTYAGTQLTGIYKRIMDLTKPLSNDTISNINQITFNWSASVGINQYRFQLSEDSLFVNLLEDNRNIFDTSYTPTYLDYNKVYYWRVSSVTKYWDDHFTEIQKVRVGNPSKFLVYQNYPNPFNNQTTLKFEVPELSWVEIELFDILGKKVKNLLSEQKEPGTHRYILTNDDLTSGIYIIRIKAGNYLKSVKVTLIK